MASSREYLDYVMGQLEDLADLSYRPMMGEYILYSCGKVVGGIYDDRFLLKPTKSALAIMTDSGKEILLDLPYDGAKKMLAADIDDRTLCCRLIEAICEDLALTEKKKGQKEARTEKEKKKTADFISEGVIAYGVQVGRFVFEKERYVIYALSDLPHIGGNDVFMFYQISKEDHDGLLKLSLPDQIPDPPVTAEESDACHKGFLCGQSAYGMRNEFTLDDADMSLAVKLKRYEDEC